MGVIKIAEGLYSIGVLNPALRIFDVVMKTEYGTSYNAYLLTAGKNVLIDTVHARFFDEYIENLKSVVDPADIDYVILNHTEPDHSGALQPLLDLAPRAQVLASPGGKIYLQHMLSRHLDSLRAVQDGEVLDIGGKTLKFIHAPFLHWPDSMFTWLESEKVAFTCDFLGAHYCEPAMSDRRIAYMSAYEEAFREYYGAIFAPFAPHVRSGLEKLEALDAETVCPSHGPILHRGVFYEEAKRRYASWSVPDARAFKRIPIFYCSAYGNTALLASRIAAGIKSVLSNADVQLFDLAGIDPLSLSGKLNGADAFLVGTPTINRDALPPVWQLLSAMDAINARGKTASAFGSYGWSGEGVPAVLSRLKELRMNVLEDGFKCRFVPSESDLSGAFEFGARFARALG